MDLAKVEKMLQLMKSYGLQEMEIDNEGMKVRLVQSLPVTAGPIAPTAYLGVPPLTGGPQPAQSPITVPPPSDLEGDKNKGEPTKQSQLKEVRSPFVGTFYGAPAPGADDFVRVGQRIGKGDTLCIIEAMKLMNEIEAEHEGVIAEILVANEEPVEYDQVLFLVE